MRCFRRLRREVRRDGHAEYLRGCPRGPNGGCLCATRSAPSSSSRCHHWATVRMGWSGRPGPPRSVQPMAWPPRPAPYICGIGADGLEVRNDDGEAACVVEKCPGWVARFASQAVQHPSAAWGMAATVGDTSARLDATPGVRLGAARAPSGESDARGRTPDQEPNVLLAAAASANVTAEAIHASQPAGRHVGEA